ncbi:hypothetical protein DSECCO2_514340 [anaerobic digester metagenome]
MTRRGLQHLLGDVHPGLRQSLFETVQVGFGDRLVPEDLLDDRVLIGQFRHPSLDRLPERHHVLRRFLGKRPERALRDYVPHIDDDRLMRLL